MNFEGYTLAEREFKAHPFCAISVIGSERPLRAPNGLPVSPVSLTCSTKPVCLELIRVRESWPFAVPILYARIWTQSPAAARALKQMLADRIRERAPLIRGTWFGLKGEADPGSFMASLLREIQSEGFAIWPEQEFIDHLDQKARGRARHLQSAA